MASVEKSFGRERLRQTRRLGWPGRYTTGEMRGTDESRREQTRACRLRAAQSRAAAGADRDTLAPGRPE